MARPDSRFHWDFSAFIADFAAATSARAPCGRSTPTHAGGRLFITPDNSTEELRAQVMADGRPFLMTTYGIARGFLYLDPADVPPGRAPLRGDARRWARYAKPVSLRQIGQLGPIGLLVTGGSAVSRNGVRFGKGHGYFDLKFAMLSEIGAWSAPGSVIADVVHDCQLVDDDRVAGEDHDVPVDWIVTPTRCLPIPDNGRAPGRVRWELLDSSPMLSGGSPRWQNWPASAPDPGPPAQPGQPSRDTPCVSLALNRPMTRAATACSRSNSTELT